MKASQSISLILISSALILNGCQRQPAEVERPPELIAEECPPSTEQPGEKSPNTCSGRHTGRSSGGTSHHHYHHRSGMPIFVSGSSGSSRPAGKSSSASSRGGFGSSGHASSAS